MRTEINNVSISNFIDSRYVQVGGDYINDIASMLQVLKFGDVIKIKMKEEEDHGYDSIVFLDFGRSFFHNPHTYSSIKILSLGAFIDPNSGHNPPRIGELRINDIQKHASSIKVYTFRTSNNIISFMGGMGSGKTASANELKKTIFANNIDAHIHSISFADTLRLVAFDFLSLFSVKLEDDTIIDSASDFKLDFIKTKKIVSLKISENYGYQLSSSLTGIKDIFSSHENYRIIESPDKTYGHAAVEFLYYAKDLSEYLEHSDFTIRNLLQTMGTDVVRDKIGREFWTNRIKSNIIRKEYDAFSRKSDDYYIIDDVRFENEAEFVKSMGGIVIGIKRGDTSAFGSHPSERTMAEHWDTMASVTIDNDGSLLDLRRKINETLKEVPGFIGA